MSDYRPLNATADGADGGFDPIADEMSPYALAIDNYTPPNPNQE
ncbi:hypothetical protein [Neisseria iguanae]|nr:hypothetical protein [Neisseria iguanae]